MTWLCRHPGCHKSPYNDQPKCIEHQIGRRETYALARWSYYDFDTRKYLPANEPPELVRISISPRRWTIWLPRGARIVCRTGFEWSPYARHYYGRDGLGPPWNRIDFEVMI